MPLTRICPSPPQVLLLVLGNSDTTEILKLLYHLFFFFSEATILQYKQYSNRVF